jgi:hypothetical protein
MKESIRTVKSMEKALSSGLTGLLMRENSLKIILKAKELIAGLTEECIKAIGKIIKWMEKVFLLGRMAENMRANIKMIKNTDMACLPGLMVIYLLLLF